MSEPLDVALRVRMNYEAAGARKALGDLDQLGSKAARVGAGGAAQLGQGLKAVGSEAHRASRDVTDLSSAAAKLGQAGGADKLQGALKGARQPAQALARDILDIRTAAERLGASSGVDKLSRELHDATRRADEFERKLGEVERRLGRSGRHHGGGEGREFGNEFLSAAGMGGALRLGMSGATMGGVAAGAGFAGLAYGATKAAREAISLETAMSEVQKAVNDLSPEGLKEMERTILRTSRETGIAKEEMAKLVAQAGFAGRPVQDLPRFATFGAKAGVAFDMPAEQTGEALSRLGNIFDLTQKQVENLADGINTAADNTAAREPQIINFLYKVGATGKQLGLTADQMTAIGAATISAGREADVAGTGFNALFQKFKNPQLVHDRDFVRGLSQIGLTTRKLKAEMSVDPFNAFLDVLQRINKLPQAKKSAVSMMLGGMEYGDDLATVAGQVPKITDAMAKLQDQATRNGSVEKTFKIFDETTQRSIAKAGTSLDTLAAKLGQRFTPAVKEAADALARLFGRMAEGVDRSDRIGELGGKLAKGDKLTPKEQAEVDADPDLKKRVEREQAFQGRFNWMLPRKIAPAPAPPAAAPKGAVPPGTGKRADLAERARFGLASYNDEVDRQLDRTEKIVRRHTAAIREDLGLGGRLQSAALGGAFGGVGDGTPRIINASFGGSDGGYSRYGGGGGAGGGYAGGGGGRYSGGGRHRGGGHAGGGAPLQDGPVDNTPPAAATNKRLAAARAHFFNELDRNPALRRDVIKTISMENGRSASSMTSVLESMVNRADMHGYKSLHQQIHDGFYGPVNRGGLRGPLSEQHRKFGEAAIDAVRKGSNQIGYRTDQGMLTDPGARKYMREPDHSGWKKFQGENYFYMGQPGRAWAKRQMELDRQEAAKQPSAAPPQRALSERMPAGWSRRLQDDDKPMSSRFVDPGGLSLTRRGEAGDASGAGRAGGGGAMHVTQNFHGGFDAHTVARRAQLEQNRAIRRSQAGALHDIGNIA